MHLKSQSTKYSLHNLPMKFIICLTYWTSYTFHRLDHMLFKMCWYANSKRLIRRLRDTRNHVCMLINTLHTHVDWSLRSGHCTEHWIESICRSSMCISITIFPYSVAFLQYSTMPFVAVTESLARFQIGALWLNNYANRQAYVCVCMFRCSRATVHAAAHSLNVD